MTEGSLDNPDLCVIVCGMADEDGEDVLVKSKTLINALGEEVSNSTTDTGATKL